jgi:hypothetical protein
VKPTDTAEANAEQQKEARVATVALLGSREPGQTVCPSEVARALAATWSADGGAENWRAAMRTVHAAVDALVAEGMIGLSWKKQPLACRTGPYRIGRAGLAAQDRAGSAADDG